MHLNKLSVSLACVLKTIGQQLEVESGWRLVNGDEELDRRLDTSLFRDGMDKQHA